MIDLMLDYALYNSCSSCNSGRISLGAPTNPTLSLLGPPRRALRALEAIMHQNPSQIKPDPSKIEPDPNPNQAKSKPKSNPKSSQNQTQIQIQIKSNPNPNPKQNPRRIIAESW